MKTSGKELLPLGFFIDLENQTKVPIQIPKLTDQDLLALNSAIQTTSFEQLQRSVSHEGFSLLAKAAVDVVITCGEFSADEVAEQHWSYMVEKNGVGVTYNDRDHSIWINIPTDPSRENNSAESISIKPVPEQEDTFEVSMSFIHPAGQGTDIKDIPADAGQPFRATSEELLSGTTADGIQLPRTVSEFFKEYQAYSPITQETLKTLLHLREKAIRELQMRLQLMTNSTLFVGLLNRALEEKGLSINEIKEGRNEQSDAF